VKASFLRRFRAPRPGRKLRRMAALPFSQSRAVSGLLRAELTQAGALCLRTRPDGRPEVLLVRTLTTGRWVVPKGWPEEGLTLAETAAIEAWEEAGIRGIVRPAPVGSFSHVKRNRDGMSLRCRVQVFVIDVAEVADDYPEAGRRDRRWMSPRKAAATVASGELAGILLAL